MALNLEELKFVVDTTELDAAAKKIGALGDALNKVNKPVKESAINAEKLAQAQAHTAEATAKAELAAAKAALAAEKLGKAQDGASSSSKAQVSILEKQIMVLEYMAQGHSRGQASMMATAKVAGAVSTEIDALSNTLKTQRTLMGTDPFDKSIGALESWTNKLKVATEVEQLYNQGLGLTKTQMQELAIEKQRLIALAAMEGKSMQQVEAEYQKIIGVASTLAQKQNTITSTIKQQDKALTDAAKATAYLADADARLAAALDVSNSKLDKAGSDALVKYGKALQQTGMSSDEAAAKLAKAKTQFDAIADKKQADRLQYLARAISVQMGDVGISLASGMNPLLVMIQQGDQIRGAIQQAGASGKELEKAMANAATQIARSFLDTGKAIGGFFVNAVKSATNALVGLPINLTKDAFLALFASADESAMAIDRLKASAIGLSRAGLLVIITALVALGVEYVKVAAAQKELTIALATNGAGLGLSAQAAKSLAESMASVGVNTLDAMRMIGEFANTGADAAIPLQTIIKSAKDMEKYVGVASKDTMKAFSDIAEKPVEGLIKLAKTTGNVSAETILQAEAYMKAGKEAEAARVAQEALAASNAMVANTVKNNLDPLQKLWIDIKSTIGSASQAVYDFASSNEVIAVATTLWKVFASVVSTVWYAFTGLVKGLGAVGSALYSIAKGEFSEAKDTLLAYADANKEAGKTQIDNLKGIWATADAKKKDITLTEEQRKANKAAAKEIEERLKNQKAATFKIPEDAGLKNLQNNYKNTINTINADSNRMITENKVAYALGLKDTGDFITSEIALIVDFNNKKISENDKYISNLNSAEEAQITAIQKAIGVAKSHAKTKEDTMALDKQLTDTVKSTREAYDRLRDSVKATNEQLADKSAEAQMKAIENLGQFTKKVIEGSKEFARTLEDNAAKRKLQIDLEKQLASLSGGELARVKAQTDAEQNHVTKLSELQDAALKAGVALSKLRLSGLDPSDPRYKNAADAVLSANDALEQAKAKSRQEIVKAGIDAEVQYYQQEYNRVNKEITDALVNSLGKGWKTAGEALRNILIAELKKPITVVVKAMVDFVSSSIGSGLNSMLGGASGSPLTSTLGNMAGSYLLGSNAAYGAAIGTTSVGAGSQAAMLAAQTGEFGAAGLKATASAAGTTSAIATAVPYVAAALVALNVLGAFRTTKQVGGGISGTLGEGDINSYATMRKSGTLIRGPSYWRENRGEFSGSDALQASFAQLKASTATMAEAVGVSSDSVKEFTKKIEISFDGLTETQIQEKIATTFKGVGDELAALVLGAGATAEQLSSLYNNIMQQRYDLETQLLELQGDTVALRERERAKIYETNQALFDQIKALEDKKAADEEAAKALEKLTSITTTIVTEINRLRGVNTSQTGLESQFAILTAQARAGDLEALAKLPAITQGLEQIAGATAVNATDIVIARARLAQSLQDTLGYTGAGGFSATPSAASTVSLSSVSAMGTGVTATVSASSSNQELLSALVTEVQGLRAEVRADVSHNAKTAKILERANQDGETLSVSATIDGGVV